MSLALASLMPPSLPLLPHAAAAAAAAAFLPYQQAAAVCPAGPSGLPRHLHGPSRAPRPSAFTVEELLKDKRSSSPVQDTDVPAIVSSLYGPAPMAFPPPHTAHFSLPLPCLPPHLRPPAPRNTRSPPLPPDPPRRPPAPSPPVRPPYHRHLAPANPATSPADSPRAPRPSSPKMIIRRPSSPSPALPHRTGRVKRLSATKVRIITPSSPHFQRGSQ
ncbi:uncharacterized protein LOC126986799 [Eriocheir sinensis]|uniref:uncharacterized protein LOC126986799 n=1 Tax=Eriocheir sinensis TaxID=95602 RepID=UPI0021C82A63|nr:uncharacterized protein LOC126986799 [Eriocheir sinensis]